MTFEAESFQNESHVTTIIQDFTPVILTFTITSHPVGLPLKALILSHLTYLTTCALDSLLPTQLEDISGYNNYLCFIHMLKNEVIISQTSLDGMEFERSVGRNWIRSSLVQISVLLLVLVRITELMARAYLWNVID